MSFQDDWNALFRSSASLPMALNVSSSTAVDALIRQMDIQRAMQQLYAPQPNPMLAAFLASPLAPPPEPDPTRSVPHSDTKLPDGILPGDGKAVGYVYGYRAWELDFKTGRLMSDSFGYEWEPKRPKKAEDRTAGYMNNGKGAGLYAAKEPNEIENQYIKRTSSALFDDKRYVIGKVALWGAIKEHQKGYRAEYAYPVSFSRVTNVSPEIESALLRVISEIYLPR